MLEELKRQCVAFESASWDAQGGERNVFGVTTGLEEKDPPIEVAAGTQRKMLGPPRVPQDIPKAVSCGNGGGRHAPGRKACTAKDVVCWGCQGKGHLAQCCRKTALKDKPRRGVDKEEGSGSLGTIRVSTARSSSLPKLEVEFSVEGS